jgi:hypothetical protein
MKSNQMMNPCSSVLSVERWRLARSAGLFSAAYDLLESDELPYYELEALIELRDWFNKYMLAIRLSSAPQTARPGSLLVQAYCARASRTSVGVCSDSGTQRRFDLDHQVASNGIRSLRGRRTSICPALPGREASD